MPSDFRLKISGSWKTFEKSQNWMNTETSARFAFPKKLFWQAVKNYVKQISKFSVPV